MSKWICLINSWTCDLHFTGQVQVRGVNVKSSVIGDTLSHETQWDHYGNEHSLEKEKERSPDWLGGCSKVRSLGRWKEARKGECGGEATVSIFQPGKPYTCVCSSPICTSPSRNIYMENDSMMVRCLPPLTTSNYFTLYIILPLKVMWRVEWWWPYREQAIFPFPLPLPHKVWGASPESGSEGRTQTLWRGKELETKALGSKILNFFPKFGFVYLAQYT